MRNKIAALAIALLPSLIFFGWSDWLLRLHNLESHRDEYVIFCLCVMASGLVMFIIDNFVEKSYITGFVSFVPSIYLFCKLDIFSILLAFADIFVSYIVFYCLSRLVLKSKKSKLKLLAHYFLFIVALVVILSATHGIHGSISTLNTFSHEGTLYLVTPIELVFSFALPAYIAGLFIGPVWALHAAVCFACRIFSYKIIKQD